MLNNFVKPSGVMKDDQSYLDSLLLFVGGSNLNLLYPGVRLVGENSELHTAARYPISGWMEGNWFITNLLLFTMLDLVIDLRFKAVAGDAFKDRMNCIGSVDLYDKVVKRVYHIAIQFRNAVAHDRSRFSVDHVLTKKGSKLKYGPNFFIRFNTLIYLLAKFKDSRVGYVPKMLISYLHIVEGEFDDVSRELSSSELVSSDFDVSFFKGNEDAAGMCIFRRFVDRKISFGVDDRVVFDSDEVKLHKYTLHEHEVLYMNQTYLIPHAVLVSGINKRDIDGWIISQDELRKLSCRI